MKTIINKLYKSIAILFAVVIMASNAIAQQPGGGTSGTSGPGGPSCSIPNFTPGTYSTQLTSTITNACAPNNITVTAYASLQFTNMPASIPGVFRQLISLYKAQTLGGSYTLVSSIGCANIVVINSSGAIGTGNTNTTFQVSSTGYYFVDAVLQYSCNSGQTWYAVGSTQSSGALNLTINQSNANANFNLGGATQANLISPATTVYNCPTNMIVNTVNTGNVASYSIKLEIGTWAFVSSSWVFTLAPINANTTPINTLISPVQTVAAANIGLPLAPIDLYNWNGGFFKPLILGYAGDVRITYQLNSATVGACVSGSKTLVQVFNLPDLAGFKMIKKQRICPFDAGTATTLKPNNTLIPFPVAYSTMPTNPTNLACSIGWLGATLGGIDGVNVPVGATYTLNVYQVKGGIGNDRYDNNVIFFGGLPRTAPNVLSITGNAFTGQVVLNQSSYDFDISNPPFFVSTIPTNNFGGYFSDYYLKLKADATSAASQSKLDALNAKIWGIKLSVTSPTGCIVSKYSYFRIVTNSYTILTPSQVAGSWKTENFEGDMEEVNVDKFICYPNPTNNLLNIEVDFKNPQSYIKVIDILGNEVYSKSDLSKGSIKINMANFKPGIYNVSFYNGFKFFKENIVKN